MRIRRVKRGSAQFALVSGQAKAVVFATGMHTEFGKIAHLTQTAGEEVSPLRKEISHLSRLTALLAVTIGLTFFCIGWMIGIPFWKAFIFVIGIIVAMVPEGLRRFSTSRSGRAGGVSNPPNRLISPFPGEGPIPSQES